MLNIILQKTTVSDTFENHDATNRVTKASMGVGQKNGKKIEFFDGIHIMKNLNFFKAGRLMWTEMGSKMY